MDTTPFDEAERLRAAVGEFVRRVRVHDAMPSNQAAVLGRLARAGAHSINDLALAEHVRHQSMARTVKLLDEHRLVAVEVDEADRRRVVVRITDAGTARLGEERRRRVAWIAQAIADELDESERAVCGRIPDILQKLTQHERAIPAD